MVVDEIDILGFAIALLQKIHLIFCIDREVAVFDVLLSPVAKCLSSRKFPRQQRMVLMNTTNKMDLAFSQSNNFHFRLVIFPVLSRSRFKLRAMLIQCCWWLSVSFLPLINSLER